MCNGCVAVVLMLEPAVCRGGRGWWHSSRGPGGVLCVAAVGQLTGVDHRLGGVPQLSPCGSFDDVKGWWRRHRARAVGRAHGRGGGTHRRGSPWGCRWSAIGVGPEGRTCDGATAFQAWRTAVDRPVVAGWTLWEPNTPFASYPALGQIEQICPSGVLLTTVSHAESANLTRAQRGSLSPLPRASPRTPAIPGAGWRALRRTCTAHLPPVFFAARGLRGTPAGRLLPAPPAAARAPSPTLGVPLRPTLWRRFPTNLTV